MEQRTLFPTRSQALQMFKIDQYLFCVNLGG